MPYITLADLQERFSAEEILSLADDGTGQIDQDVINRAAEDASGEIDGYVAAGGYTVPMLTVPRIIRAYACDIARYRMYDDAATEQVRKRYEDAIKFLRLLAEGKVKLGLDEDDVTTAGSAQFTGKPGVMPGGGW
ncbi:hypothetical protein AN401_07245 [Zobellella denitrificans]|uniref:DUF1320 domain-containing protein n=1 Tax=Zobellella denitrificans TaxID=347534 RepID=A0A291HNM0_9GAMM|nr:DUF1320 domain-containing protein [Zobellella denitrificans]ATG73678.1 hypothetical protein AN401_07245 [Zobellella denitrificans]